MNTDSPVVMSGNNISEEGTKALGPHLAKLTNMVTFKLNREPWRCYVCVREACECVERAW